MPRSLSDVPRRRSIGWLRTAALGAALCLASAAPLAAMPGQGTAAQAPTARAEAGADSLAAAAVELSPGTAALSIELAGGREAEFALRDGSIVINGQAVTAYTPSGALESSWRALLDRASTLGTRQLATLLREWDAPEGTGGDLLETRLREALQGVQGATLPAGGTSFTGSSPHQDSIDRLLSRIEQLQERVEQARPEQQQSTLEHYLEHFVEGLADLFRTLVMFGVLLGLGWAGVYFMNERMERVADTVRADTLRSGLIGLASAFLAFPLWLLGIIALAISIVGIPLLLGWVPLFPFVVAVGAFVGYLTVARAAGEALVERHFSGADWYQRANAYYYMAAGLALLLAPFALAAVFQMPGHLLGWLGDIMMFIGVVLTIIVTSIGFGAVVIRTRAALAARRARKARATAFDEETHV